ncbi:MAG: radical SAM protein, partial [Candidatus Woesearchaeota archaeon]
PLSIEYETTLRCNLNCDMCYQKEYRDRYKEKNLDEMKAHEFIDNIGDIKDVSITGGECLQKEDILDLIDGLQKKGIRMKLLTNGATTEETIKTLKKYPFVQIRTSIDGPEEIHDKIRKPGSFKATMNFIEEMKDKDIRVNSVRLYENQGIETIHEMLNKKGIKTTIIPDETYTEEQIEETRRKLSSIIEDPKLLVKKGKNKESKRKGICKNLIYQKARIDPEGNVIACRMIRNSFGNIKEQSLQSIWNSKEFQEFRHKLSQLDLPICQNCPKRMK